MPAPKAPTLPPAAKSWLDRATASYRADDVDDARDAIESALAAAPNELSIKLLSAKIHMARLEFAEASHVLQGLDGSEARALRGRARWYAGDLEGAADDFETLLKDPGVKDDLAASLAKLARSGSGRKPFQIVGAPLAPLSLARVQGSAAVIIPVQLDGEDVLAVVATNKTEVIVDSSARHEPSWVQLRFADRIEVHDVPALSEDLSGFSKQLDIPVKMLLGINLLRRLHVTFDLLGDQFIVRSKEPPPPPKATRIGISYAMGGAMIVRASLHGADSLAPLLVNSLLPFPLALNDGGWKLTGIDMNSLKPVQDPTQSEKFKSAVLPTIRLGAFDISGVPGVYGPSFKEASAATGIDLDGAIGGGLLAGYRCTLAAEGRAMWLEDFPDDDPLLTAPPPADMKPPVQERGNSPIAPPTLPPMAPRGN